MPDADAQAENEAVQRKSAEAPLRRHLNLHHYCGPIGYLEMDGLNAVHETAARQDSHPEGEL